MYVSKNEEAAEKAAVQAAIGTLCGLIPMFQRRNEEVLGGLIIKQWCSAGIKNYWVVQC